MRPLSSFALIFLSLGTVAAGVSADPPPDGTTVGETTPGEETLPEEPKPFDLEEFLGTIEEAKSHVKEHLDTLKEELEKPGDIGPLLDELLKRKDNIDAAIREMARNILGAIDQLVEGDIKKNRKHIHPCGEFEDYVFSHIDKGEKIEPDKAKLLLVEDVKCFHETAQEALRDLGKLIKQCKEPEKPEKKEVEEEGEEEEEEKEEGRTEEEDLRDVLDVVEDVLNKLVELRGAYRGMMEATRRLADEGLGQDGSSSGSGSSPSGTGSSGGGPSGAGSSGGGPSGTGSSGGGPSGAGSSGGGPSGAGSSVGGPSGTGSPGGGPSGTGSSGGGPSGTGSSGGGPSGTGSSGTGSSGGGPSGGGSSGAGPSGVSGVDSPLTRRGLTNRLSALLDLLQRSKSDTRQSKKRSFDSLRRYTSRNRK